MAWDPESQTTGSILVASIPSHTTDHISGFGFWELKGGPEAWPNSTMCLGGAWGAWGHVAEAVRTPHWGPVLIAVWLWLIMTMIWVTLAVSGNLVNKQCVHTDHEEAIKSRLFSFHMGGGPHPEFLRIFHTENSKESSHLKVNKCFSFKSVTWT